MTRPEPLDLDVCPMIRRGEEPFAAIMTAVDDLQPGQHLRLLVPFRPAPLFTVMANRGYTCRDHHRPDGVWEVLFSPLDTTPTDPTLAPGSAPFAQLWPEPSEALHLSGRSAPEAVTQILEALEDMPGGAVLFVLLDAAPMALLPELAQRGHEWAGNPSRDGASYRLMVRVGVLDD